MKKFLNKTFFGINEFLEKKLYTPNPVEAEFDGLTAGFETIQLCP